jgi:hypothetical protein
MLADDPINRGVSPRRNQLGTMEARLLQQLHTMKLDILKIRAQMDKAQCERSETNNEISRLENKIIDLTETEPPPPTWHPTFGDEYKVDVSALGPIYASDDFAIIGRMFGEDGAVLVPGDAYGKCGDGRHLPIYIVGNDIGEESVALYTHTIFSILTVQCDIPQLFISRRGRRKTAEEKSIEHAIQEGATTIVDLAHVTTLGYHAYMSLVVAIASGKKVIVVNSSMQRDITNISAENARLNIIGPITPDAPLTERARMHEVRRVIEIIIPLADACLSTGAEVGGYIEDNHRSMEAILDPKSATECDRVIKNANPIVNGDAALLLLAVYRAIVSTRLRITRQCPEDTRILREASDLTRRLNLTGLPLEMALAYDDALATTILASM